MQEVNDDDKLWSALSWAIPLIAIVVLLIQDKRSRPFIKYHAVNSLAFGVAVAIVFTLLTVCTFGFGGILVVVAGPLTWLVTLYWAYLAYQGQWVEVPVVTNFVKNQGWV